MVMPYWKRNDALQKMLQRLKELYSDLHAFEVVIADDGSPEPALVSGTYPWPVSVIRLPSKKVALNPCVPINRAVEKSIGDKIVITNPEVVHREPILRRMAESDGDYVAAACLASTGIWYCHSTKMPSDKVMGRAPSPKGAGLHFCSMLSRELYEAVGGFSEEYRDGQGYDDNDFLWKLHEAGASFRILDDCVTDHIDAPRCEWPSCGLERNKKIFESKWLT
jgi:hypothetical protein